MSCVGELVQSAEGGGLASSEGGGGDAECRSPSFTYHADERNAAYQFPLLTYGGGEWAGRGVGQLGNGAFLGTVWMNGWIGVELFFSPCQRLFVGLVQCLFMGYGFLMSQVGLIKFAARLSHRILVWSQGMS